MPIPCPRTLLALKEFLPDDTEFEDFVRRAASLNYDVREYAHDLLFIGADEEAAAILRETAERILQMRKVREAMRTPPEDSPGVVVSLARHRRAR